MGQRARRRCAGRDRQQARRAAPGRDAGHHACPFAAGGGARARPPRRLQGDRRGAAHVEPRREGNPTRGHHVAGQARRRASPGKHPGADPEPGGQSRADRGAGRAARAFRPGRAFLGQRHAAVVHSESHATHVAADPAAPALRRRHAGREREQLHPAAAGRAAAASAGPRRRRPRSARSSCPSTMCSSW